jgi:hypothetical protein
VQLIAAEKQVLCEKACVQTSTAIKTLWVMQDVCWNFLKPAILKPGQRLHRAHVITTASAAAGTNLCSIDVAFNFLLIAEMQQHDCAREPGLHFAASPMALGRVQYVLILSLLYIYLFIMSLSNQGTVQQSESTILLSMSFSLDLAVKGFGERPKFLSKLYDSQFL